MHMLGQKKLAKYGCERRFAMQVTAICTFVKMHAPTVLKGRYQQGRRHAGDQVVYFRH